MQSQSSQPKPTRGHRQRQRTRSAILEAGQRLLASRPLEGITIDDIVAEADVAKGSFYNHFSDKEELARSIQELVQGDCEFHIFSANADITDPPQRIARALCVMLRYAQAHPDRLQAVLSMTERKTTADSPLNVGLSSDIRHGIEGGRLKHIDQETGVLVVLGLISLTIAHLMSGHSGATAPELGLKMGTALLRSLGLEQAEAEGIASDAVAGLLEERP